VRSWWVGLALAVIFFAIYIPVIREEEVFLRGNFPEFDEYAMRVPRMFPRVTRPHNPSAIRFSIDLYLKHREYNAVLGAAGMVLVLLGKMMMCGKFPK
jgi:hypothetical protein